MSQSVEIIKPITDDVKEFSDTSDFIKYYDLNKTALDKLSTCALNKKFKVKGYHLGRKKGELKLIPLNLYRPSEYEVHQQDTTIEDKLDILNMKLDKLINAFNKLLSHSSGASHRLTVPLAQGLPTSHLP